jgi:CheY-like chemotaxis protein
MVVDDDRRYLASLTDTLSTEFSVTPCANGPEALERLDDEVQAIVLDIKMAHMNGLTVAEKVMASHEGIPIIFNTGYPGEYVKEDIENRYHPFGYVTKDDPGKLLDLVRRAADGKDCVPA